MLHVKVLQWLLLGCAAALLNGPKQGNQGPTKGREVKRCFPLLLRGCRNQLLLQLLQRVLGLLRLLRAGLVCLRGRGLLWGRCH